MSKVLETILTGRNLLSPVLAQAGRDVVAFNSTVAGANTKAATTATTSAAVQDRAADKITASNVKASTSATASTQAQTRAHTRAAESATVSARVQQTANGALIRSNGLLGTSLTPLTAGLGATALALGYAGYKGMEFDSAMSQVQAASQATAADMSSLRDAAVDAGAKTQYSAVEAAQGITEMSKAGVSAKDILGGGLTGALNLAAAGQISVAEAAETGATALSVFNLAGSQMSHVADLLAAGAGKAQGSVGDLSAALNQSALVANQTGLSIEDTAGALALFASNGLVGSDAGTSFKAMLQALTPNSLAASKAMEAIGFSAYDAQGSFVGMESVAGQLRTGLAGLTEEQRNTTLETIFGSDAVRAASVLYKEGAAGVQEWAGSVNDAGYASRQAAQLTDNLGGDLERLGGAVDSFFTKLGSGAQGPLREVVQALTGLVDIGGNVLGFIASLPGPLQAAVIGLAAFAALRGPLDALFTRLAVGITSTVTGMGMAAGATTTLGIAAGAARAAVTSLVTAAAPLAVAFALTSAVSELIDIANAGDQARTTVTSLDEAIKAAEGNDARFLAVRNGIRETRDEMARYQEILDSATFANPLNPFADHSAVYDAAEAIEVLRDKLGDYEDATFRAEQSTARLSAYFSLTGDEVLALADKYGIDLTGSLHESQRLFENFYSMEYGDRPTEAAIALTAATEDTRDAVDEAKQAVDDYKLSLDILSGRHVSMLEVESSFQAALAQSTDAMDDLGGAVLDVNGHLNLQSENGRTAADVLLGVRDSGNQLISTMIQQGATTDEVRAKDAALRESFIRSAEQMNISRGDAERLADQILGIPAERETTITADTGAAEDSVARTQRAIDNMHGRDIEIRVRAAGRFIVNPQGGLQEFAEGGWTGPGAKYTPAGIVHADEFVVPKSRVNALGGHRNVGALVGMPGYAEGGPVLPINILSDSTHLAAAMDSTATAMKAAAAAAIQGGTAGTGAVTGQWISLWNLVKGQIPQARINSTYRPGDPGYHGRNKAIDFGYGAGPGGAGSAGLASINRLLHDQVGRNLAELIYDGIGDDRPDLKNGKPLMYSAGTRAEHRNHVHAAVYDQGGPLYPGLTVAYNGTGQTEWVSKAPAAMPGYGGSGFTPNGAPAGPVNVTVQARVFVGDREITDIARVEAVTVVDGRLENLYRQKVRR